MQVSPCRVPGGVLCICQQGGAQLQGVTIAMQQPGLGESAQGAVPPPPAAQRSARPLGTCSAHRKCVSCSVEAAQSTRGTVDRRRRSAFHALCRLCGLTARAAAASPLVPADEHPDAAKLGAEHLEPGVPWGEVPLLLIPRTVWNVRPIARKARRRHVNSSGACV